MTDLEEKLQFLCFYNLVMHSPVLSGNMQSMIQLGYDAEGVQIIIDAPYYDMEEFRKNRRIVHTGETKNGMSSYALLVNESGGFSSHNKSEHWVNRVLDECCRVIATEIGGEVINELQI